MSCSQSDMSLKETPTMASLDFAVFLVIVYKEAGHYCTHRENYLPPLPAGGSA